MDFSDINADPSDPSFEKQVEEMRDAPDGERLRFIVMAIGHVIRDVAPMLRPDDNIVTTLRVGTRGTCMTTATADNALGMLLEAIKHILNRDDAIEVQGTEDYRRISELVDSEDGPDALPTLVAHLSDFFDDTPDE